MKSYTIIVKTLSTHMIIVILHFWVKIVVFEQKQLISLKTTGLLQKQEKYVQKTSSENLSLIQSFSWILQVLEV